MLWDLINAKIAFVGILSFRNIPTSGCYGLALVVLSCIVSPFAVSRSVAPVAVSCGVVAAQHYEGVDARVQCWNEICLN